MLRLATGRRGRVVRNLLSDGDLSLMGPVVAGAGAVTFEQGNRVAVFSVGSGAGQRAVLVRNLGTTIAPGRTYALSCKIDYVSAGHGNVTTAQGILVCSGIGTPATFGPQGGANSPTVNLSKTLPSYDGCRIGVVFTPAALSSPVIRLGFGANANDTNGLADTLVIKLSDIQLEELELGGQGPSEYVGGVNSGGINDRAAVFNYPIDVRLSDTTTGVITMARGKAYPIRRPANIVISGDSYADATGEYPLLLQSALPDCAVRVYALGGGLLGSINALIPDAFRDARASDVPPPDHFYLQTSINDALSGLATYEPLTEAQIRVVAMVARARAAGVRNISIGGVPAVGASASHSPTNGDQYRLEAWNGWLKQYCAAEDLGYVDLYRGLGVGYPNGRIPSAWAATTAYAAQAIVRPVTPNGLVYMVTAGGGGNSGAAEPTWPVTLGGTVVDGALTWTTYRAVFDPALSAADEGHPDATGHQRYADLILPHLFVNDRES
jgi:lysophospholipase L1-like esterase